MAIPAFDVMRVVKQHGETTCSKVAMENAIEKKCKRIEPPRSPSVEESGHDVSCLCENRFYGSGMSVEWFLTAPTPPVMLERIEVFLSESLFDAVPYRCRVVLSPLLHHVHDEFRPGLMLRFIP